MWYNTSMPIVKCFICSKEFHRPKCHIERVKNVFCSAFCRQEAQKISITKICKICGESFDIRPSESHKFSTCSKECYLKAKSKENNGNWHGGVTLPHKAAFSTAIYKQWRKSVFERDNSTCVMCGQTEGMLHADHIMPWAYFPELRYEVSNGRVLCLKCHSSVFKDIYKYKK